MSTLSRFSARARTHWLTVALALLLFIPLLFNAAPAQAGNFSVGTPPELVNAIATANTNGQDDVITLAVTTYSIGSTLLVEADNGHSLTITSAGATLHASSTQLMNIASGANVILSGTALTGGNAANGGSILNNGTLTLNGIVPFGNTATTGGAVYNNGTLVLNGSVFLSNTAATGGAIYNSSTGVITMTGGAIRDNNRATGTSGGAGIYNDGGAITLINSTVAVNSATAGPGGAIAGDSGTLLIRNSTIAYNTASQDGGISFDGNLTIHNSIVANNSLGDCSSSGTATVQYSLIEAGGCGITNGVNGNLTGDPDLGTYIPERYPLNAGSIAINSGNNTLAAGIDTDATGSTRIQGGVVDMGSYETNTPPPTLSINDVTLSEGNSGTTTFNFTVSVSPRASTGGLTFDIATADNSALVSDNDYAARSLTGQAIAERGTSYTFDVTVNGDITYEANETFFVNITNVVGATVADGQGLGTINNDDPAPTTTTVSTAPDPSIFGQTVTLTAEVTSVHGTPTGTVQFFDAGNSLGSASLSGGMASIMTSALTVGTHNNITAVYTGNASFATSTSSLEAHTVNQANTSTSVTSAPDPSVFGQAVTLTATVTAAAPGAGTPTGTVGFYDGSTFLGSGTLNGLGAATFTTSAFAVGSHDISATYLGNSNFNGSTSSTDSTTVNQASTTTTITADPDTSVFGEYVILTASVAVTTPGAGTFTGSVQFFANGTTPLGNVPLSGGTATLNTNGLPAGIPAITAVYSGDTNFSSSTSAALPLTVNYANTQTTLNSSPNPAEFGQTITFTAVVAAVAPSAGTPSGTVYFLDGSTQIGSATLSGDTATFTTSALTAGLHTLTARYGGVGGYNESTSTAVTQTVNHVATTTTVSSAPNPSAYGQAVTLTATVTASASGAGAFAGTVAFYDGATHLGSSGIDSGGTATLTTSSLLGGSHSITAVYGGGGNYSGSISAIHSHAVNATTTTTSITANAPNPSVFGQGITITASVTSSSGTPTGTVEFFDSTTSLGTATLSSGTASLTTSALAVSTHTVTARYLGDSNFALSTSAEVSQVVNKANTTTSVTTAPNPSVFGESVTLTASVAAIAPGAGTPTGTVTFYSGSSSLGTATLSGGTASLTTSALNVGTHSITATYNGDESFNGSTSSADTLTVNQASATTTVISDPNPSSFGQAVTFTASVNAIAPGAGTPTGEVEFFDGATSLGTATLSGGTGSLTTGALMVGSHTITAEYGGDEHFTGSTATHAHTVDLAAATTAVSSTPNPSAFGQSVTLTATVTTSTSGTAGGSVEFFAGTTSLGTATLSGGTTSLTTSALAVGSHAVTAVYSGDENFTGSASPVATHVVGVAPAGTTLVSSPNPSYVGETVALTATVTVSSGSATGTVEFYDGATSLGTAVLVGDTATMSTSTLAEGTHALTAVYSGDESYQTSISTALVHTVNPVPIITVNPATLLDGTVEFAYSQAISASGGSGSYTFAVTSGTLPAGLALDAAGTLSGAPTLAGAASFTVTATDTSTSFTGERAYTLVIHSAPPPPPPAPYAEDINFDSDAPVRTGVPETLVDSISLRILYQNGQPTQWLGGDLYNAGSIGVQGILDLGVQQAVDIFSPNGVTYFNGGAVFCLRGSGPLIWLAASGVPRHAEIIGSYTVPEFPGYTCATLFEPGTLVLVRDMPQ